MDGDPDTLDNYCHQKRSLQNDWCVLKQSDLVRAYSKQLELSRPVSNVRATEFMFMSIAGF